MECVYRGFTVADVYLMRDWLERNDLDASIRGRDRMGLIGDIPVPDALPTIWVPKSQVARAKEIIEGFNAPKLVHPAWVCAGCGEENPASFGSCWSCSSDGPLVRAAEG